MTGRAGAVLLLLAPCLAISACARPGSPAGGPVPEDPLSVVATNPADGATVEPFEGPVTVRFQRTVSERPSQGSPNEAVIVSPESGRVEVRVRGEELEVSTQDGFLPGLVYRVTVLPRFRDRYQNPMASAFDLFFSTGPALEPTLLAGVALDRITMRGLGGARVDAAPVGGGPALSTAADSTGMFTFPHLLAGQYTLSLYEDRNRSGTADGVERRASRPVEIAFGDTLVLTDLALLAPDDTPAALQTAAVLDSLSIRLTFEEFLDPTASLVDVVATIASEDVPAPAVVRVLHRGAWDLLNPPANAPPRGPTRGDLPSRELVLVLSAPLAPDAAYQVDVQGVTNLAGVAGGGGRSTLTGPRPR